MIELLNDEKYRDIIKWEGGEGEFKLVEPDKVAQEWGAYRNNPNMDYEKFSCTLRHYYNGGKMIKGNGNFMYKFIGDFKNANAKKTTTKTKPTPRSTLAVRKKSVDMPLVVYYNLKKESNQLKQLKKRVAALEYNVKRIKTKTTTAESIMIHGRSDTKLIHRVTQEVLEEQSGPKP